MTDKYSYCFNIGWALAFELGESGRLYFHELSRMATKFKLYETENNSIGG